MWEGAKQAAVGDRVCCYSMLPASDRLTPGVGCTRRTHVVTYNLYSLRALFLDIWLLARDCVEVESRRCLLCVMFLFDAVRACRRCCPEAASAQREYAWQGLSVSWHGCV